MWTTELVTIVRLLIDDAGDTPKYSDERVQSLILIAANQLISDMDFDTAYQVNVESLTLSPDPTETATRDSEFINFVTVKAACVYGHASACSSARKVLMLRDGGTTIDTSKQTEAILKLLEKGWCAVYEKMKYERAINSSSQTAVAILGPIRAYVGV